MDDGAPGSRADPAPGPLLTRWVRRVWVQDAGSALLAFGAVEVLALAVDALLDPWSLGAKLGGVLPTLLFLWLTWRRQWWAHVLLILPYVAGLLLVLAQLSAEPW